MVGSSGQVLRKVLISSDLLGYRAFLFRPKSHKSDKILRWPVQKKRQK